MGWIRKRLRQRSTANGAALATMILGFYITPEAAHFVVGAIGAIYSAYEIGRDETKNSGN
tara:strand:+ start:209 stop:388 length:180 start_codon:yes stop_codon:yes gene_type:complete